MSNFAHALPPTDPRRFRPGRRLDPERALAFAMGLHVRLGRASPARRLDDALARHVLHDLAAAAAPRRVEL